MRIRGFSFDVEVLMMAQRRGYRIAEVPVNWTHQPGSKVNLVTDSARMLRDLFVIRGRYLSGQYNSPHLAPWSGPETEASASPEPVERHRRRPQHAPLLTTAGSAGPPLRFLSTRFFDSPRRSGALLAALFAASAIAELRSIPRADVAFLLFAAARVLDGARLYVDVVEINPPLIVALNLPVVLAARALGLQPALVYQLAVFALLGLSLAASSRLLRRLLPDDPRLRRGLVVLLALVLFAMPGLDLGEREHLMLALILPYVWLVGARVAGWAPPRRLGVLVGICAGVGFALKPQFLPGWLLIEVYRRWHGARRWSAPSPESLAVLAVLLVYGVIALVVTPEYFPMVRLLGAAYGRFLYDPPGRLLLTSPSSPVTLLSILAFVALRRNARHGPVWDLLLILGAGMFLGGLLQFKGLEYHFYPARACCNSPARRGVSGRAASARAPQRPRLSSRRGGDGPDHVRPPLRSSGSTCGRGRLEREDGRPAGRGG